MIPYRDLPTTSALLDQVALATSSLGSSAPAVAEALEGLGVAALTMPARAEFEGVLAVIAAATAAQDVGGVLGAVARARAIAALCVRDRSAHEDPSPDRLTQAIWAAAQRIPDDPTRQALALALELLEQLEQAAHGLLISLAVHTIAELARGHIGRVASAAGTPRRDLDILQHHLLTLRNAFAACHSL